MSTQTYNRRKEHGLCVRCGKIPPITGGVMCLECTELSRKERRERREFLRNLGLCPRCGKNKLFGDEKECPECVAMMYELNKKSKEKRNFNASEWYKNDIKKLKEQGMCRSCRKSKVAEGHTYCPICLEKKRKRSEQDRRKQSKTAIPRSERPSYGLCYICGDKIDRKGNTCSKCASKLTKSLPDKNDNAAWREDNKIVFKRW